MPPEGGQTGEFRNVTELLETFPTWRDWPPVRRAVSELVHIDAYEPLALRAEQEGFISSERDQYRRIVGFWPESRHTQRACLLRLIEYVRDTSAGVHSITTDSEHDDHSLPPVNESRGPRWEDPPSRN